MRTELGEFGKINRALRMDGVMVAYSVNAFGAAALYL